jgi:hypothetical protein
MNSATFSGSSRLDPITRKVQWRTRFVTLPHGMVTHPSFLELTGNSAKLLLAVLAGYTGSNNGHLVATFTRMQSFGFNSKESVARALRELISLGYIVRCRTHNKRSPALYALTWLPINSPKAGEPYDAGVSPSNLSTDTWRHVQPMLLAEAA